jgi:LmbE family N-acetylglucosaminyl deacetylase
MENWYTPYQTAALPAAQKVWVLAPHPDDEVFGCGGAALIYAAQGAQVQVSVMSSGTGYAVGTEAEQIQSTRENETNAALQSMGIEVASFWRLPDRGLGQCAYLAQRLFEQIQSQAYQVVFAPSLNEVHPDHLALTRALIAAFEMCQAAGQPLPYLVQYEVGAPIMPNLLLDISKVWPRKLQAMQCFTSQLQTQNYAKHIEALNTYRTYALPLDVSHAEAFYVLQPDKVLSAAAKDRWFHAVMAAAEVGAEELQLQVVQKERQIVDLQRQFRADLQSLQQHADTLLKRTEVLDAELQRVSVENERKRIEVERLATELNQERLQAIEKLNQQRSETTAKERELLLALEEERQIRETLLNSKSWRFTKPLRWVAQWFSSNQA